MVAARGSRSLMCLAAASAVLLLGCTSDETDTGDVDDEFDDGEFDDDEFDDGEFDDGEFDDEFDDGQFDEGEFDEGEFDDEFGGGEFDDDGVEDGFGDDGGGDSELLAELESAGFCDPADVESEGVVTAMHFVVDGQIQPACYTDAGGDDPRLLDAWTSLTDVTPSSMYDDVSLLAGFESCDDCDTLAFVTTLDEAASFFLLAVSVDQAEADSDELRLTMLHELTHVFGQNPRTQLDVTVASDECPTWFNGNGCYRDGAYLLDWLEEFWDDELLAELPDDGSPLDDDTAAEVCATRPDFTGSYAATHPEEDFAETFSAYVFDVEVGDDLAEKLAFFDRYPEFVEIRDRARAAGLSGLPGSFEGCG